MAGEALVSEVTRQQDGFAQRLAAVRRRISAAEARAGRPPGAVKVVAIGKTYPAEVLRQALEAGQRRLGENRVQEAEEKIPVLPTEVEWHLVGHLQSNKARRAARLFQWVHSLDSARLSRRLSEGAVEAGKTVNVLVQVKLAAEEAKSGVLPGELTELLSIVGPLPGLALKGLMILPPLEKDPEETRPYFRRLRKLAEEASSRGLLPAPCDLSMGMSGDYEVAVEEGATLVRVGTALFGRRKPLRD
jgi:pyridoxal phosphate enzyme (YggS family)